jgi:hypothetical protein
VRPFVVFAGKAPFAVLHVRISKRSASLSDLAAGAGVLRVFCRELFARLQGLVEQLDALVPCTQLHEPRPDAKLCGCEYAGGPDVFGIGPHQLQTQLQRLVEALHRFFPVLERELGDTHVVPREGQIHAARNGDRIPLYLERFDLEGLSELSDRFSVALCSMKRTTQTLIRESQGKA